jgi:hypothetical protein
MISHNYSWDQEELFKEALEKLYEVSNNPKKNLLYSKAYELGHSSGLHEVEYFYDILVDLIY